MTRAVLYTRISESDDASTSIDRQRADLEDLASREGWTVVEGLVDDGVTGRKSRPKALRAVDMLADGSADVLAVWKFDRFSREGLRALAELFDALESREDARFVALKDSLDSTTPAWRIVASVLAEVARMESENTKLRVRSTIQRLRTVEDKFSGGNVPTGYRTVQHPSGKGRALEVDPDEAAVLREVAERVIKGASLSAEALRLNEEGRLKPRRAKAWKAQSLLQAITGPAVVGRVTHDGRILTDPTTGLPRQVWEPALPLDVWHGVRAALAERKKPQTRSASRRSRLLSRLAVCASCEHPMYLRVNGRGFVSYACGSRSQGLTCSAPAAASAERLEERVVVDFLATMGDEPVIEYRPHEAAERPEVGDLREAIERTHEEMKDRSSDRAALLVRLEDLEARLDKALAAPVDVWDQFVETGETYHDVFASDDVARKRSILAHYLTSVTVAPSEISGQRRWDPDRIDVRWDERWL